MGTLETRVSALEDIAGVQSDPFDIIKENGLEQGLAILEAMGEHAGAQEIRETADRARRDVLEWERVTFGSTEVDESCACSTITKP